MSSFLSGLGSIFSNYLSANPIEGWAVNTVANALPKTYSGTPIRNLLGITPAYAAGPSSTTPSKSTLGISTGPASYPNTSYGPTSPTNPTSPTGGNGGSGSGNNGNLGSEVTNAANAAWNAAMGRYNTLKGEIGNVINNIGTQKDSLLSTIGDTYDNALTAAKNAWDSNLATLNQGKTDVQNSYDAQKQEEARLLLDTQRQNRMLARSLGDLGSSYYENLQSGAAGNTAQNISTIGQTETSQLAKIADSISSGSTDYNTKVTNLNQLEAQAKQDVISKYQDAYNQAQLDLATGASNNTDELTTIANNMQSTLDNISYLMGQYKTDAASSAGANSNLTDFLQNLNSNTSNAPLTASNLVTNPQNANTVASLTSDINSQNATSGLSDAIGKLANSGASAQEIANTLGIPLSLVQQFYNGQNLSSPTSSFLSSLNPSLG